ncbi:DUF3095 domain-containing protein [Aggregatimonas sangjinii]|uniref:DUF3095 domain-containing protein n=1 Tax=Aggregatimonas sangjinii TaxID=2583587 RepID=A0A5B7SNC4_9FLAO|nr:DUF3095 family protein [Aggregatimonas sangjinii]QCX00066.1 DUF3095 domain-containing protein [Aggregatimonas sangjinii]
MVNRKFYQNLPKVSLPLSEVIKDPRFFHIVPKDWSVVVADVKDSTIAMQNGLHNEVNLAATGGIVSVLNALKKQPLEYKTPYFFGGDGVNFLVPNEIERTVMNALKLHSKHVLDTFDLVLRIGVMGVSPITATGRQIRICKYKLNQYLTIPIVLGTGLKYAENHIKETYQEDNLAALKRTPVNLKGMECRWDEVAPEQKESKVVCLLVACDDDLKQNTVYARVISKINTIFGTLDTRQPITTPMLKLDATIAKIRKEMYARIGRYSLPYLIKNWLITRFGVIYFKYFKRGKDYVFQVSQLSDTLMIDGTINTVMKGTTAQIEQLTVFLDGMEQQGALQYGLHITYASVMSCYIQDGKENHIHFVDGTEGGYTAASQVLKIK